MITVPTSYLTPTADSRSLTADNYLFRKFTPLTHPSFPQFLQLPMRLRYFDAKPYFDTDTIRSIMWNALAYPNEEMRDRLLNRYHDDDDMRLVGAMDENEDVQAIIGLKFDETDAATILHLRVENEELRNEISRAIIRKIISLFNLNKLSSRTSESQLRFYTELGFEHWPVGEKPRGTTWYGVRWESGGNRNS